MLTFRGKLIKYQLWICLKQKTFCNLGFCDRSKLRRVFFFIIFHKLQTRHYILYGKLSAKMSTGQLVDVDTQSVKDSDEGFDGNDDKLDVFYQDAESFIKSLNLDPQTGHNSLTSLQVHASSSGNANQVKSECFDDFAYDSDFDFSHLGLDEIDGKVRCSPEYAQKMRKKKATGGSRANYSFSNQRLKEIERENQILYEKIMRSGPSGDMPVKPKGQRSNPLPKVKSYAEADREKSQSQINYENVILRRKLNKIANRRPPVYK